jgi:plastocyanin
MVVTIGPGNSYSPASVTIKPTGHVRWINSGVTHTVTSN